jgi:hypothetical protein
MNEVPAERIALHVLRHLVRSLGKKGGQRASLPKLRHWWTISLGQRAESLERGLAYATDRLWIERGPDNAIFLTVAGFAAGSSVQ